MSRKQFSSWGLHSILQLGLSFSVPSFFSALDNPGPAQNLKLSTLLHGIKESRQASRIPHFSKIKSALEFQEAFPLCHYEDFVADIEDIKAGVPQILTNAPVLRFEKTGGSSGKAKFIPQTSQLLKEFQLALNPWIYDLYSHYPKIKKGPGYWSLSPIGQKQEQTSGGISVGSVEDSAYFPAFIQFFLNKIFAVPGKLAFFPDVESCRYVTLRYLLETPTLAMISIWNPSFLTLLFDTFECYKDSLLNDLKLGVCRVPDDVKRSAPDLQLIAHLVKKLPFQKQRKRAEFLQQKLQQTGQLTTLDLWPDLSLISSWASAQATHFLGPVEKLFPQVKIQGKGLLSTEGVVSIPLAKSPAPVLAICSHFYEFIDLTTPDKKPYLAHELAVGKKYEVVLSTGGGLLRYRTGDCVQVVEYYRQTPCVEFLGRVDAVSDLVGEKLNATYVENVISQILQLRSLPTPRFLMLAPELGTPPHYHLFIENELPLMQVENFCQEVENKLCESYHYGYARKLGQLGPVQATQLENGVQQYEKGCLRLGQRAGDIKPVLLHRIPGWSKLLHEF